MNSFNEWCQTSLGQSLFDAEQNAVGQFLPALKGDIAVQYGYAGTTPMLETSDITMSSSDLRSKFLFMIDTFQFLINFNYFRWFTRIH